MKAKKSGRRSTTTRPSSFSERAWTKARSFGITTPIRKAPNTAWICRRSVIQEEAALRQDARQDRECGDAHGGAEKEREMEEGDRSSRQPRVEIDGEEHAEQEGGGDAGLARDERHAPLSPQEARVELQPDQEHE